MIECRVTICQRASIHINETLARSLVLNLIKNAFIHTSNNGEIDITLDNKRLTITNTGVKALDYERLFDRFYTETSREGSTGLGLAIVKSICDHYGFGVTYSYNNGGHVFVVELQRDKHH